MTTTALAKREKRKFDGLMMEESIAHLMNMKETAEYFYGDKKKRSGKEQQLRLMALLCTIKTAVQVGVIFGVNEKTVQRARRMYRDELKDAAISRNMIVAGLAERKAIEALQNLDVLKIPDERKPRAVKDLMDSASLAGERIKPKEDKKEETTYELIYRIKNRPASQPLPKPAEAEEAIDAEFEEQPQIPEKTP